jgi:hypothetical protein
MKKITLLFVAVIVAVTTFSQTVTTNWERSDSLLTRHVWNAGDNTRGLAFGTMGGNERLFVATRSTTGSQVTRVIILNALTGDSVSVMNMTGVTGGTHVISDAGLTEDGVLLVSNLTTAVSSTSPLKIYKWTNETAAPTVAVQWGPAVAEGRYGDKITVTGKISDGTARIYAVKNISGTANIKYWDMMEDTGNPGTYIFNQTPKNLFDVSGLGVLASIGLRPDGGSYYKINGANIKQYTSNGTLVGSESSSSVIASSGNNVRYIGDDNQGNAVICYFRYSTAGTTNSRLGNHKVDFVRVLGNDLANATVITGTPSLGKTANGNGAGGIVVKKLINNDVELYVLSTNNGVAKYTISGLMTVATTSLNTTKASLNLTKTSSLLKVNGTTPSSIELFNTLGQKVQSVSNKNELNISSLRGVHIVKVNANGVTSTQKINL